MAQERERPGWFKRASGLGGLKSGSGFYDYSGRDVADYRRDVLARTLGMLKHAGLWRAPADDTLP